MRAGIARAKAEIAKVVVGQDAIVDGIITALIVGGHVLLEGVPGLGKTLMVRTMSSALDLPFSRIQFTPDLMPADITGTTVLTGEATAQRHFKFEPGPIFASIVLADEINRATPKTQSALLEAMQEQNVTVGNTRHALPAPFCVLATQNPLEMEGTYPLPEAQLDRFLFKLIVEYPSAAEMAAILDRTTGTGEPVVAKVLDGPSVMAMRAIVREVPLASHVRDFVIRLVESTHPGSPSATDDVNKYIRYGASPRAAQALVMAGKIGALIDRRYNVSSDDIKRHAASALRHRIALNFEGDAEGVSIDSVIAKCVDEALAKSGVKPPI